MFFRNLTFFRFPTSLAPVFADLDARLEEARLRPVGPSELSTRGFVSPFGRDEPALSHRVGDALWITLGGEERLLPSAVVNDALGRKITELEEKEGRKLGGRARKRLKEDLVLEMLPRAFVRPVRTGASLDLAHGFLAVDRLRRVDPPWPGGPTETSWLTPAQIPHRHQNQTNRKKKDLS